MAKRALLAEVVPRIAVLTVVFAHRSTCYLLPTLWFRNTWWKDAKKPRPMLSVNKDKSSIHAEHQESGDYDLQCEGGPDWVDRSDRLLMKIGARL